MAQLRLSELREWLASRRADGEDGQGMVEYAFILVLIALVTIAIVTILGKQTNNLFSNVNNGLNG
jgi:pilus assembly protein Flp/PilA